MPLIGCQIGSSAATERVDGPPNTPGFIVPAAPWTCTIPSPCGCWAKACCAASLAFLNSPIDVSDLAGPDATRAQVHRSRFATDPKYAVERRMETGTRFSFAAGLGYADRVSAASTQPAIDGWFATDGSGAPYLIGAKCHQCGTCVFPPRANNSPNPACHGDELAQVPLSRRGTLWSYPENRYAPPPPYPSPDPFEPFAVAAVALADEGLIVLGKGVEGTLAADLKVGMAMELTTMPLFTDDEGVERVVYAWRIA